MFNITPKTLRNLVGFIALSIPFLAMVMMIAINTQHISGTEYRFKIAGYDPRDILRGHYLVFQYQWPDNTPNHCTDKDAKNCCACFTKDAAEAAISFMPCDQKTELKSCEATLRMTHIWNGTWQPHEDLRRYYIPEKHAYLLEQSLITGKHVFEIGFVPYKNTFGLSDKNGRARMLYIDNMTLPHFLFKLNHTQATH